MGLSQQRDQFRIILKRVPCRTGIIAADFGAQPGAVFPHPLAQLPQVDGPVLLAVISADEKGTIFRQHKAF